jgi:hypothetical protein
MFMVQLSKCATSLKTKTNKQKKPPTISCFIKKREVKESRSMGLCASYHPDHRNPRVKCWSVFPVTFIIHSPVYHKEARVSLAAGMNHHLYGWHFHGLFPPCKRTDSNAFVDFKSMENTAIQLKWMSLLLKSQ